MNTSTHVLPSALGATAVRLSLDSETVECTVAEATELAGRIFARKGRLPLFTYLGPASAVVAQVTPPTVDDNGPSTERTPAPILVADAAATLVGARFSDFGSGKQVTDDAATARIEAQHAALNAAGVRVDASKQLFATGTRMARSGYSVQEARHKAFLEMRPAAECVGELVAQIEAERREDVTTSTYELARAIGSNGTIRANGKELSEQAIRSLLSQIGSPATSYVLGVRDRVSETAAKLAASEPGPRFGAVYAAQERAEAAIHADVAQVAAVLAHELRAAPEKRIKLRTRAADVFAIVSPSYVAADAPTLAPAILRRLPEGARATAEYDAASTEWSVRLDVWTPTPVADHAVGEAYNGYVALGSADNGTRAFRGGGGICLVRCLNASTYEAEGRNARRIHRGRILHDVGAMIREARSSVDALIAAWGVAREAVIAVPEEYAVRPVSEAMPWLFRGVLGARELVGVLPGRTETHVAALAAVYPSERRDPARLVRADVANAVTRYAQSFPAGVQRDAEAAIGAWTVSGRPVRWESSARA